ncbi:MAG TPA: hypothetical protein VIN57_01170 [Magnetovibrio sp.]
MKALFQRLLFLLGIALTTGAFVATAAEIAASVIEPGLGMLPGADQVWRVLAPNSYQTAQDLPAAGLWLGLLQFPGWVVFGGPGLLLIVLFRQRGEALPPEHEQSLYLFDELTRQAREDGFDDNDDDLHASGQTHFVAADEHYASDDLISDLHDGHDFLLDDEPQKRKP